MIKLFHLKKKSWFVRASRVSFRMPACFWRANGIFATLQNTLLKGSMRAEEGGWTNRASLSGNSFPFNSSEGTIACPFVQQCLKRWEARGWERGELPLQLKARWARARDGLHGCSQDPSSFFPPPAAAGHGQSSPLPSCNAAWAKPPAIQHPLREHPSKPP